MRLDAEPGDDVVAARGLRHPDREIQSRARGVGAPACHEDVDVHEAVLVHGSQPPEELDEPLERVLVAVQPEEVDALERQ